MITKSRDKELDTNWEDQKSKISETTGPVVLLLTWYGCPFW